MVLRSLFSFPRAAGALFLASAFLANTGCVSMDEHQRLQTAFDEARRQLAEDENDLGKLRQRVSDLEAQVAEKDQLLSTSGNGWQALKADRDKLAQQLAELQDKYNQLLQLAQQPNLPENVNDALSKLAEQYPDVLEYDPARGLVRFKSDLTFDLGSTEVKPRAKEALAKFAQVLNMAEIAKNEVRVVGNTDDVPIRATAKNVMNPTNWNLSTNRAISVVYVLKGDDVAENRFQAAGFGEFRPIAPNAPGKHGNEKNRRVDVYILPSVTPDLTISTPGPAGQNTPVRSHRSHAGGTAPESGHAPATAPAAPPATAPGADVPMPAPF